MAVFKRGDVWWYEFIFAGRRIRESAKTSRKTIALEAERGRRLELEKTLAGLPVEKRENRINSVAGVVKKDLAHYEINHRAKSVLFANGRLAHVARLLGPTLLQDLTDDAVPGYIKTRLVEKASGRTINMEVGELSRAVGHQWSILWPKVRKLEERKDVGIALSPEQERRLLDAVTEQDSSSRSQTLGTFLRVALLTGMRAGEITSLSWSQVDLESRIPIGGAGQDLIGHRAANSIER